jgi:PAT family beta-lactamase induction signal transducer AmpG
MEIYQKQSFKDSFKIYFDKRMIRILLLGIISGFPWVLIGSSLSLWLKEEGLSRSTIGWAGLIFAVYAFNYLWAPLIDRIRIPWLTNKIGHRRGWIVTMQLIILISLVCWNLVDPTANLALVITVGLIIAIASATQDITVDALRIEQIGKDEGKSMQAGAAMAVVGWWTGYKLGGVIALNAAEYFEQAGFENYWQLTFLVLSVVIIVCNIGLMFVHESQPTERQESQRRTDQMIEEKLGASNVATKSIAWITGAILGPLMSFFKKNGFKIALGILAFVFLFKIGEAFLGRMSIIFYKEIGFTKGDIALYSKGLGWITTVVFTLLGGLFAIRSGVIKAMFVAGILMASTNLLFSALSWYVQTISLVSYEFNINLIFKTFYFETSNHELFFGLSVVLDDMTAAFATVAFVAFISMLVDRTYTATQYALLASIGTAGRTTLAASSGAMVDWLNGDWGIFFVITAVMVIPSLICLYLIKNKMNLSER